MPLWPRCTTRCKRLGGNGLMGSPAISQTVFRLGGEIDLPAMVGGMRRVLQQAGCSDAESMRMVTVASELSNNIIRYAGNGRLTVVVTQLERRVLIEITAEDRGPRHPQPRCCTDRAVFYWRRAGFGPTGGAAHGRRLPD